MKSDPVLVRGLTKDMVTAFLKFEADVIQRVVKRGIAIETATEALVATMYECLFETIHMSRKLSGKMPSAPTHEEAFQSPQVHEEVAHRIISLVLDNLKRANPTYLWSAGVAKRKRGLKG